MLKRMNGKAVRNRRNLLLRRIRKNGSNHREKHKKLSESWNSQMMMMKRNRLKVLIKIKSRMMSLKSFYAKYAIKSLNQKSN